MTSKNRKVWGFGECLHTLWHGDRVVFDSCRDMGLSASDALRIERALNADPEVLSDSLQDATERADQAEAELLMLRQLVIKWDPRLAEVIGLKT